MSYRSTKAYLQTEANIRDLEARMAKKPETQLAWNLVGQSIVAHSNMWHDEGSLLDYMIESNGDDSWTAHFEGHALFTGPLHGALDACEKADVHE